MLFWLVTQPSLHATPVLVSPSFTAVELVAADGTDLQSVDGLAFDGFGNLFAVLEISGSGGGLVYVDKGTGAVTELIKGISRADQVAVHPSGDLFITSEVSPQSTTNRVYRAVVTYDGDDVPVSASVSTVSTTPDGINNPEGLAILDTGNAFGDAGDLFVAEDTGAGRIIRIDPDTGATDVLVDTVAGLDRPEGLAFGDFGGTQPFALYAAETNDDNILRIASDGSVSVVGVPAAVGLNLPDNVEFGPDGFLYVSEDVGSGNGRVLRISSDGTHSVVASALSAPQGMAFDPTNGDLYVSERGANSIWRLKAVPEPASAVVLGLGAVCLARRRN